MRDMRDQPSWVLEPPEGHRWVTPRLTLNRRHFSTQDEPQVRPETPERDRYSEVFQAEQPGADWTRTQRELFKIVNRKRSEAKHRQKDPHCTCPSCIDFHFRGSKDSTGS